MKEWKLYKLSDFIHFNPTLSLKKGTIAKKITMDQLIPYSREIYSWVNEPYSGGAKFQNGDTIMARITPCLENGKHAYVSILDNNEIAYGSTEYFVMRGIEGVSDNLFVYYLTHYPEFKNAAIKSMVGSSGRQRAQLDVLKNLEYELPDLDEQIQIATLLSSIDDKIALNKRINDNLEQQAQTLYKSWFVDFEPFKDGAFKESEFGLIPEGWRVGSLSDLTEITMGQSPSGKSYNETGDGMLFYQGRAEFGDRYPSIRLYTTEPSRIAEQNSVLLSVRAPVGDTNIAYNKCCIGRGLASITAKHGFNSFIFYMIKSLKDQFDLYNGEGTVFGSINRNSLNSMKVIVPTNEVINDFEKIVAPLDFKYKSLFTENLLLTQQRDTLLPKLMSGELKINDLDC